MRYSCAGKPICCRCRRLATSRLVYRSKNDAGAMETSYIYHCQAHAHETLSKPLPDPNTLTPTVVRMHDVVRYRGLLYRVMGHGSCPPHPVITLFLRRIGPQGDYVDIKTHLLYPQVIIVKPCMHDWRTQQSVLAHMETNAYRQIAHYHKVAEASIC